MKKFLAVFLISFLFIHPVANAKAKATTSDYAKEKRWADQVVDGLIDGDEVWLKTNNPKEPEFLGILTEAEEDKQRAAIVIHGSGVHPDWQQVVQPLRVGLTTKGWHTLSIQMPILPNEAEYQEYAPLFDEVAPRIEAAIKYLKGIGAKKVVIVAHSLGSAMSAYYLSKGKSDISAFVGIGMGARKGDNRMDQTHTLRTVSIPILDLYGSDDLETVLKTAQARLATTKQSGNKNYEQVVTKNANHFYDGKESELISTVSNWLEKN